jgi:hypothetical protein
MLIVLPTKLRGANSTSINISDSIFVKY